MAAALPFDPAIAAAATPEAPLSILTSACLTGLKTGWLGTDYAVERVQAIVDLPNVRTLRICPEDMAFGTPRPLPFLEGGNGLAVLDGRARMRDTTGADLTDGAVAVAHRVLAAARKHAVQLAIMLDISPSCGPRVIYHGDPEGKRYQKGPGVTAALLVRSGIPVLTHRDDRFLDVLHGLLDPAHRRDPALGNHFEGEWYTDYFGSVE